MEHNKWRKQNPEAAKAVIWRSNLKKSGWTPEHYEEVLKAQDGRCLICDKEASGRRLDGDHDHVTNEPRGLLCSSCNGGLGFFGDDPKRLKLAALYLEVWRGQSADAVW